MTKNQIDYASYIETVRHNMATEQETSRHNVSQEAIGQTQASAAQSSAAASWKQAQVAETKAHTTDRTNATANYINALTNQRAQDLKEDQYYNPLGGLVTKGTLEAYETGINVATGFIRLVKNVMN